MSLIDTSLATLQPAPVFPELYQELWWYSGSYASGGSLNYVNWLAKGSTSFNGTVSSTPVKLFTLNSAWPANLKYAFECSLYVTSGSTAYATLWDITSNTQVTGTEISTTSTNATVLRSGQVALTPGHSYGVAVKTSGSILYITDASLIVFPSSPLTSPIVSAISLANPSGNTLKEAYIPLWVYSSGNASSTAITNNYLVSKGATTVTSSHNSANNLYALSSSWSPNQKFAFETSAWIQNNSGYANVNLYDVTAGSVISSSEVSISSTTATVMRSGSFTLTPGHVYGVSLWTSSSSYTAYLTKAHLVALAQ